MKWLRFNSLVCAGKFFGGEIEPGVFHIQNDKGSEKEPVPGSNGEKATSENKAKEPPADSCSEKSSAD